jgi:hypothetical protein
LFYVGRHLAHVGELDQALPLITRAVEAGYSCYPVMASDPWLGGVRSRSDFQSVLERAKLRWAHASKVFEAAGGPELLAS